MAAIQMNPFGGLAVDEQDFNGAVFEPNQQGEREVAVRTNAWFYLRRDPAGADVHANAAPWPVSNPPTAAEFSNFVQAQASYLYSVTHAADEAPNPDYSPDVCVMAATMRWYVLRTGCVNVGETAAQHHCRYEDSAVAAEVPPLTAPIATQMAAAWAAQRNWRKAVQPKVTDIICLVAYFFRARGHHYLDDFQQRYADVYQKTLPAPGADNLVISWKLLATTVTHAIYPDTLDGFWRNAVDMQECAGTLAKRFTTAPAGMAAWYICINASADLFAAAAGLAARLQSSKAALDRVEAAIKGDRWYGSVNARLYGSTVCSESEVQVAAVGAAISAILTAGVPGHPMLQSKALKRVAEQAPITGFVVAAGITEAVKSKANTETLLLPPA